MKSLPIILLFAAAAAAQTCKYADYPVSGPVDGTLQRTGCTLADYVKNSPTLKFPALAWRLVVTKTAVYKIRITSTTMDPFVILTDDAGAMVDWDDDSAGGTDSELLIQLTPGGYNIVVAEAYGLTGSFRLSGESSAVRTCRPKSVELPSDTDAELTGDDCRFVDIVPMISSHAVVDTYSIQSKKSFILTARMDSTAVDSVLGFIGADGKLVASDDNSGGGKNAKLRLSVGSGTGILFATAPGTASGAYRLKLESEDLRRCDVSSTTPGRTVSGVLESDGCRLLDALTGSGDENKIARYRFELRQPVLAKLAVTSADFDTHLMLVDANGRVIAENDNTDPSTTNSALTLSLSAGTYTAVVRGLKNGMGAFEMSFGTEALRKCEEVALAVPGTTAGALSSGQCRYLDLRAPSTGTFAAQVFQFKVEATTFVSLAATGTGYTPNIDIYDANGKLISPIRIDSKIDQLLLAGEYRVIAWHRTGTGDLSISASTHEPVACTAIDITPGSPATGTLNGLDCMLRDVVPLPVGQVPADVYAVRVAETDTISVRVTATKDEFLPVVYVLDGDGKIVAGGIEALKFEAPAGTYRIVASTVFRGGGDYSLSVSGNPLPVQ